MKTDGHQPVDFSNESYEAFEAALIASGIPETSPAWTCRDMAFSALFHDPLDWSRIRKGRYALFALPAGWIAWLYSHHWQHRLRPQAVPRVRADHHFLCLSSRSNHVRRIGPEAAKRASEGTCHIWCTHEKTVEMLRPYGDFGISMVSEPWADWLDTDIIRRASQALAEIRRALPLQDKLAAAKLASTFAIREASTRFWDSVFVEAPVSVLTTYEKDPLAKGFLEAARRKGTSRRVHWTHGLRHASQRVTESSELWCLTPADARYFASRLPAGCTPHCRRSPEADHWLETIGLLPETARHNPPTLHFLVLGSGFDPGYSVEMSVADMKVIAAAINSLGERVRWRFRPHPGNIARFRQDMEDAGIQDADFSTRSLGEDLGWSHAVGSSFSSVLLDIEPTGRPIFWIQAETRTLYSVDQMIADGFGIQLDAANAAARIRDAFGLS